MQVFGEIEQFSVVSCVYSDEIELSKTPVVGKTTVIEVTRVSEDEESKEGYR